MGCELPRIWTKPLRELTPETTLGFAFIEFCTDTLGWDPLPWQRWWSIHALELVGTAPLFGEHQLRFRKIITLVGRQSGKTTLLTALALFFMFCLEARMVLGAAQTVNIAMEAWRNAVELAEDNDQLSGKVAKVRYANGDNELLLTNRCRYRTVAANRGSARGLSVNLLILDEIREHHDFKAWSALSKTTIAQANGLIVAISNAGDDESVVLNQLREAAIFATDDPETTTAIFEWSAPDGCDIDDWDAIAQGMPGLGYIVPHEVILDALRTDPPGVFRTEILCQKVESLDTPITPEAWEACADPAGTKIAAAERKYFCLDVSPDGEHATLAAAAMGEDGKVRVGVVAAWTDLNRAVQELPDILVKHKPKSLSWFPGGPAAAILANIIMIKSTKRVELKGAEVPAVCQGFAEQANSRQIIHGNDPLLAAHVLGSRRLPVGDGWRFARRGGNADAAYAAAGAVHSARIAPKPQRLKLITSQKLITK